MLNAALTGFVTGLSLIMVIGAQNAFVLRQGLMRAHVFAVCLFCAVSDALLIITGVGGAGGLTRAAPWVVPTLALCGAIFLFVYGVLSMWRALDPGSLKAAKGGSDSLRATLTTCFALTWLNPHVYLDTVGLIGIVSTYFVQINSKTAFALGAVAASFAFFFSLGYGARSLAPIFARPKAWATLDAAIALIMWTISIILLRGFLDNSYGAH